MIKSIKEISWNVSESVYREDSAVSYSMLAAFEREGPKVIPTLKDKKSSDSLRFGALVDTLLTDIEEFDNKFLVADIDKVSEAVSSIIKSIFEDSRKTDIINIEDIDRNSILRYIKDANYYNNWKDDTRVDKIINDGKYYFQLLCTANNRDIVTQTEVAQAKECVRVLKSHPFTMRYFTSSFFEKNIEHCYQLKFKYRKGGLNVRCMFDKIIVDHELKTIQPIDLKTTGKDEEHFEESFLSWSYWIQANMYSEILKMNILEDDYFKDFTILPFKFIVINRYNKTPMVWEDPNSLIIGNRLDIYGNLHKYWRILYEEFQWHVHNNKYDYSYDTYMQHGLRILNKISILQIAKKYEHNKRIS